MHLLVVDDNSPTAPPTRSGPDARLSPPPSLDRRKKRPGAAYIRGIRHALQELGADAVMQMDADFSHQPADVPRLLAALDAGADFVIGSRYVPGGKIPDNWGWSRKFMSRWGNFSARYLPGSTGSGIAPRASGPFAPASCASSISTAWPRCRAMPFSWPYSIRPSSIRPSSGKSQWSSWTACAATPNWGSRILSNT